MRQPGFTLLEVTFVLFIMLVTAFMTTPTLLRALDDYRLTTAAHGIAAEFRLSRTLAATRQQSCRVRPASSLLVTECDPLAWQAVRSIPLSNGLTVAFSATPLFHANGFVTPATSVSVSDRYGRQRQVIVNMTGRVRVQ